MAEKKYYWIAELDKSGNVLEATATVRPNLRDLYQKYGSRFEDLNHYTKSLLAIPELQLVAEASIHEASAADMELLGDLRPVVDAAAAAEEARAAVDEADTTFQKLVVDYVIAEVTEKEDLKKLSAQTQKINSNYVKGWLVKYAYDNPDLSDETVQAVWEAATQNQKGTKKLEGNKARDEGRKLLKEAKDAAEKKKKAA